MQLALVFLVIALPLLELAVMIKVGQMIGVLATLLLLVAMSALGGVIMREQGFSALRRMMAAMQAGKPPVEPVVDSMFLMLAGLLLLIPGFITDVAGLLLLIPPVRRAFAHWLLERVLKGGTFTMTGVRVDTRSDPRPAPHSGPEAAHERGWPTEDPQSGPTPRPRDGDSKPIVIDGEWERVDEPGKRPRGDNRPRS